MFFDEYAEKYPDVALERKDGILQVRMKPMDFGGPLDNWPRAYRDLGFLFDDIARDNDNKVVIFTGTGDTWIQDLRPISLPRPPGPAAASFPVWTEADGQPLRPNPDGKRLQMTLLNVEIPMIGVLNGPANIHAELPFLCDIVLAADDAYIQDIAHIPHGMVPGDGVHVVWPVLMGLSRARYFLLTGQKYSAQEAFTLGLVNEVLPRESLLPRAWELAEQLALLPPLAAKGARVLFTQDLKRRMLMDLGYGFALETMNEFI
jgi:enoyl-CoA hydratase/carnithine racemase